MAEEIYEEEEGLTAEELFEQHKQEIAERFEEKGFFRRIGDMFKGFQQPKGSREYKLAVQELQRLKAPIIGVMLPVLGVIALIVITAVQGQQETAIQVDLARPVEDPPELKDDEPEPDVEPPETPPEEVTDIVVDTPVAGPVSEMVSDAPPTDAPLSVKPAPQDAVAIIKSPVTMRSMTGSRTPGSIGAMTRGGNGYGDASTEAAVLKVLRWLKKIQKTDGSYGGGETSLATTALAVLTYLAHGEKPGSSEEFGYTVEKALQFLIGSHKGDTPEKSRFAGSDANEYSYLIATYALCEAYGMTRNPNAKEVATITLQRIVNGQSPTGSWDYKINPQSTRDDLSFAGWALQALKAGKMAGLHPEGLDECIKKAIKCLKTRSFKDGGFRYTVEPSTPPSGLTATGCLAMQLLGYGDQPEVRTSLDSMRQWLPTFKGSNAQFRPGGRMPGGDGNIVQGVQYYCYYAAQCKYQAGMKDGATADDLKTWQDWNVAMKKLYPTSMITLDEKIEGPDGKMHAMGYWDQGYRGKQYQILGTCLCALQLMVYYRYLPATKIEKAADTKKDDAKSKKAGAIVDVSVDI